MANDTALMLLSPDQFAALEKQAKVIAESRLVPKGIDTWQKVLAVILTGHELGIPAMAALRSINVIQGTPSVSPQLMLALIYRSGTLESLDITDDGKACIVTMKRTGLDAHTERFSMEDAARIKTKEDDKLITLAEKFNWRSMPAIMRKWRAVAACARVVFPDLILGLYTADELGDNVGFTPEGEIVTQEGEIIQEKSGKPADVQTSERVLWQDVIATWKDHDWFANLWGRLKKDGIANDELHTELGVASMKDFTGYADEVKAAQRAIFQRHQEKPATEPPAPEPPARYDMGDEPEGVFLVGRIEAARFKGGKIAVTIYPLAAGTKFKIDPLPAIVDQLITADEYETWFGLERKQVKIGTPALVYENQGTPEEPMITASWDHDEQGHARIADTLIE